MGKFNKKVANLHFFVDGMYNKALGKVTNNEGHVDQFVSSLGGNGGMDGFGESGN